MPCHPSVLHAVERAQRHLEANHRADAERALATLAAKLGAVKTKKRKPGKYALWIKANYRSVANANPGKAPPQIMKLLSKKWKETHA